MHKKKVIFELDKMHIRKHYYYITNAFVDLLFAFILFFDWVLV